MMDFFQLLIYQTKSLYVILFLQGISLDKEFQVGLLFQQFKDVVPLSSF